MKRSDVILLLSGGIDSTTLLAQLRTEALNVHALSFDYGQRHSIELEFARQNAQIYNVLVHHVIKIDYSPMSSGNLLTDKQFNNLQENGNNNKNSSYVPGRNLLMISHAAAYAEAHNINDVYFAANADDAQRFPDCSSLFVQAINKVWQSTHNTNQLRLITPYINLSKTEVIQLSKKLNVNLNMTLSCYSPTDKQECGTCLSCRLKQAAMNEINVQ